MGIEEEAEKRVDLVLQLEKDVKLLKKKVENLTKQIDEQILIGGFQDQLNRLSERLLETERFLASSSIVTAYNFFESLMRPYPTIYRKLIHQLLTDSTKAHTTTRTSNNPLNVVKEFKKKWFNIMDKNGLEYIKFTDYSLDS